MEWSITKLDFICKRIRWLALQDSLTRHSLGFKKKDLYVDQLSYLKGNSVDI